MTTPKFTRSKSTKTAPSRKRSAVPQSTPILLLPSLRSSGSAQGLFAAFKDLLRCRQLQLALQEAQLSFYDRIFSPLVTLWYMIFQRLHQDHSLQAAVTDAHQGGADALGAPGRRPLSARIRSLATTALSNARQRLPLSVCRATLAAQGQLLGEQLRAWLWRGWRVALLDGSQIRLRPFKNVLAEFPPSANQRGHAYWVLMRTVVVFCAHTGAVLASAVGATTLSEQALAVSLIRQGPAKTLYIGDANFGVFWMVRTVLEAQAQGLFRLTKSRAAKLLGSTRLLTRLLDQPILWTPSAADRRSAGADSLPLRGRLLVLCYQRPGFRTQWLYLFTTLTDAQTYTAQELFQLYGLRWQVELDLRYVKTQMELHQLECKSAAMAEKEWLTGLMAYNLVRALMVAAAVQKQVPLGQLSFTGTRRLLLHFLTDWSTQTDTLAGWESLLDQVACLRQPTRTKPRPSEPRRKRHIRESFPPLRGSRAAARKRLQTERRKS